MPHLDDVTKYIVTTSINEPTEALLKYNRMPGWNLVVAGDMKTDCHEYVKRGIRILTPEEQIVMNKELSDAIGWNTIQRRNMATLYALQEGADIIAFVDDDNIPLDNWPFPDSVQFDGTSFVLPRKLTYSRIYNDFVDYGWKKISDPLLAIGLSYPHRGFPIVINKSSYHDNFSNVRSSIDMSVDVIAGLWTGEPDIDAITRINNTYYPLEEDDFIPGADFLTTDPMGFTAFPFNSQNTIMTRRAALQYFLYPGIGRYDDIVASYILQSRKGGNFNVAFTAPTVRQDRNEHNILDDLEQEMWGYRNGRNFVALMSGDGFREAWEQFMPSPSFASQARKAWERAVALSDSFLGDGRSGNV